MAVLDNLSNDINNLDIKLEREDFSMELIASLSETLQDVLGITEASGIISVVGQKIGDQVNQQYLTALKVKSLPKANIANVLIDLKNRIHGKFYLLYEDNDKIILGNDICPFAEKIKNKPSLCMLTSNVFGRICAVFLKNKSYKNYIFVPEQAPLFPWP